MYVWFESEMVPVTTIELHAKMVEKTGEDEVNYIKHMARKLVKQYGKYIAISQQDGKPNIVCFRNVTNYIIATFFKDKEIQKLSVCERIIKTTAKSIKSITKITQFTSNYSLREKCPNTGLFLVCIFLYSIRTQENTDQK